MKLRFPWNMALLWCSWVFFELSLCFFPLSWPVYPLVLMWLRALDEWFTIHLAISQIISSHTPTLPNSIDPRDDDSTHSVRVVKPVVCEFDDSSWLNLTNDSYHAEVVHDITIVDERWFSSVQFNSHGRVRRHRHYDFTHFRSDFSKPSIPLNVLLLRYINETQNKIPHKRNPKSNHWHNS